MSKVTLKRSHVGMGVWACEDIFAGELILHFQGSRVRRSQIPTPHGPENDYYLQIDDDLFLGPSGDLDDFVNHSCNPNAGVRQAVGGLCLCAIRNIMAGEEVCFDYSTVMDGYAWQMRCACRSAACRGVIGDFLQLPHSLKQQYVTLGIVPDYILRKLAPAAATAASTRAVQMVSLLPPTQ